MVEMELSRILVAETRQAQLIVLKEKAGNRAFPIVIGFFEASAINTQVNEIPVARPLTHHLLGSVIKAMGGELEKVIVNDLREGTFYGRLIIKRNGEVIDVDTRPSDGIALAVQTGASIFVEDHVLDEVYESFDLSDLDIDLDMDNDAGDES